MNLIFREHAIRRMFERGISVADVERVLSAGQVIAHYPEDKPYPSRLLLGWIDARPLHVVAADNEDGATILITVYSPDPALWDSTFTRRRP